MISNVVRSLSTPSWWMPDSCAKALRPTIALFGCTTIAGEARDEAARAGELGRHDAGVQAVEIVAAGVQQHHDLLERGVAGALADAVDRALDLARAGQHAGERVGDREPEVVVAVRRDDDVASGPATCS